MSLFYRFHIALTALIILLAGSSTHADDYKWLKAVKHENVFVYADLKDCGVLASQFNEAIKILLKRSGLNPSISDSLFFQPNTEGDRSIIEFINNKLIENNKIFFHVYGRCIDYGSAYIYQFDVSFARFDNSSSQAIIYSVPKQSVIGVDKTNNIKKAFTRLIENAAADYISANRVK